ncbi:NIPSNAP family containing protein [Planotetraspora silvatica]|uniref:NIPSNAP family containing protein n=1 Tax=Planotetraspora silvatica TaxID=234614 RepID=A0A8J3UNU5_9ACTN|nr:NIPSNAP family protein [Planotetraspora silvatica]GII46651.1 NIPSNAP family containing protein [Planotetraspora silvatica]
MTRTGPAGHPAVLELRQYTLRPGRREELIELFEREFIETQEETGMIILGQFRDLDDPDRFIWLRGFQNMETRREALSAFYGGPVWAAHGPQANDTMVDSDNVLLLRPLPADSGFAVPSPSERPQVGAAAPDRFVAATLWHFPPSRQDGTELIRNGLVPALNSAGPASLAVLTTETAPNTFPRLPVRTGENIAAVFTSYADEAAHRRHVADVLARPLVQDGILSDIERAQAAPPQSLRLAPTARSLIR